MKSRKKKHMRSRRNELRSSSGQDNRESNRDPTTDEKQDADIGTRSTSDNVPGQFCDTGILNESIDHAQYIAIQDHSKVTTHQELTGIFSTGPSSVEKQVQTEDNLDLNAVNYQHSAVLTEKRLEDSQLQLQADSLSSTLERAEMHVAVADTERHSQTLNDGNNTSQCGDQQISSDNGTNTLKYSSTTHTGSVSSVYSTENTCRQAEQLRFESSSSESNLLTAQPSTSSVCDSAIDDYQTWLFQRNNLYNPNTAPRYNPPIYPPRPNFRPVYYPPPPTLPVPQPYPLLQVLVRPDAAQYAMPRPAQPYKSFYSEGVVCEVRAVPNVRYPFHTTLRQMPPACNVNMNSPHFVSKADLNVNATEFVPPPAYDINIRCQYKPDLLSQNPNASTPPCSQNQQTPDIYTAESNIDLTHNKNEQSSSKTSSMKQSSEESINIEPNGSLINKNKQSSSSQQTVNAESNTSLKKTNPIKVSTSQQTSDVECNGSKKNKQLAQKVPKSQQASDVESNDNLIYEDKQLSRNMSTNEQIYNEINIVQSRFDLRSKDEQSSSIEGDSGIQDLKTTQSDDAEDTSKQELSLLKFTPPTECPKVKRKFLKGQRRMISRQFIPGSQRLCSIFPHGIIFKNSYRYSMVYPEYYDTSSKTSIAKMNSVECKSLVVDPAIDIDVEKQIKNSDQLPFKLPCEGGINNQNDDDILEHTPVDEEIAESFNYSEFSKNTNEIKYVPNAYITKDKLDDWEAIFKERSTFTEKLLKCFGKKVLFVIASENYEEYQNEIYGKMEHAAELFDIPNQLSDDYLLNLCVDESCCIKRCDETHAILITSSVEQTKCALSALSPLTKSRCMLEASPLATILACSFEQMGAVTPNKKLVPELQETYGQHKTSDSDRSHDNSGSESTPAELTGLQILKTILMEASTLEKGIIEDTMNERDTIKSIPFTAENVVIHNQQLILKLMEKCGRNVAIITAKEDYEPYRNEIFQDMEHVIELYNIPKNFRTANLRDVYPEQLGYILWCDNTTALLVTGSILQAKRGLHVEHEIIKSRPIDEASPLATILACKYLLLPIRLPDEELALEDTVKSSNTGYITNERAEVEVTEFGSISSLSSGRSVQNSDDFVTDEELQYGRACSPLSIEDAAISEILSEAASVVSEGESSHDITCVLNTSNIKTSRKDNWADTFIETSSFTRKVKRLFGNDFTIVAAAGNYEQYQTDMLKKMEYIIELFNIPETYPMEDLLNIYTEAPRYIKRCDDSHALLVTGSPKQAARALHIQHDVVKSRPLAEASPLATLFVCQFELIPAKLDSGLDESCTQTYEGLYSIKEDYEEIGQGDTHLTTLRSSVTPNEVVESEQGDHTYELKNDETTFKKTDSSAQAESPAPAEPIEDIEWCGGMSYDEWY